MTAGGFLETLLSLSLQAALLIAVTRWLTRRPQAEQIADRLWMGCHVAILCLTILGFAVPHMRLLPHAFLTSHPHRAGIQYVESIAGTVILWIWLCGVALSTLALIRSSINTAALLKNASPIDAERLASLDHVASAAAKSQLLTSQNATGPFCWQIHQPAIVLPEFVLELPDEELQMIVRHEAAHLRAAHPLHLFLQRLVEAIFWFHPLVWSASREADCCREFLCDREAVGTGDPAVYLRSLLSLAERAASQPAGLTAGLPFGGNENSMQKRAARLAESQPARPEIRPAAAALWTTPIAAICVIAALIWIPVDASASDRTVWSPWPRWSAAALHAVGIPARDYEIDGHRVRPHEHVK